MFHIENFQSHAAVNFVWNSEAPTEFQVQTPDDKRSVVNMVVWKCNPNIIFTAKTIRPGLFLIGKTFNLKKNTL